MKRCTIQIRDEVNIKLEGLDLDARKALVNAFNPLHRSIVHFKTIFVDGLVLFSTQDDTALRACAAGS